MNKKKITGGQVFEVIGEFSKYLYENPIGTKGNRLDYNVKDSVIRRKVVICEVNPNTGNGGLVYAGRIHGYEDLKDSRDFIRISKLSEEGFREILRQAIDSFLR